MSKIFGSSQGAINKAIASLVGSAPEDLNTLGEIALALADSDSESGALVAQDTQHSNQISQLQTDVDGIVNSSRTKLFADTTYYIDTAGDNANDGLTSGTAIATIAEFLRILQEDLDLNGHRVTAILAAGDYTAEGQLHLPTLVGAEPVTCGVLVPEYTSNAQVIIKGVQANSTQTTIVAGFELDQSGYYGIGNCQIKLDNLSDTFALSASRNGVLEVFDVAVISGTGNQVGGIRAEEKGYIKLASSVIFNGNFGKPLYFADNNSYIESFVIHVNYLSDSLASVNFIEADNNSTVNLKDSGILNVEFANLLGAIKVRDSYVWVPNEIYSAVAVEVKPDTRYGFVNNQSLGLTSAIELRGKTNREAIFVDKTLTNIDPAYQNLINNSGGNLTVSLPTSPNVDRFFAIINNATSTNNIVVNSVTLLPDERYEVIFDGVEWIVL